jgi:hypothetical protein
MNSQAQVCGVNCTFDEKENTFLGLSVADNSTDDQYFLCIFRKYYFGFFLDKNLLIISDLL